MLLSIGIIGPHNVMSSQRPKPLELAKETIKEHETKPAGLAKSNVQQGNVMITQPRNGNSVPGEIEISGTHSKEINDDIWVIIWPEKACGKGWPQSNDAESGSPALKKNGQWFVYCYFGGPPKKYEIAVYTATDSASLFLGSNLKECYKKNDYKGIYAMNLPIGLIS